MAPLPPSGSTTEDLPTSIAQLNKTKDEINPIPPTFHVNFCWKLFPKIHFVNPVVISTFLHRNLLQQKAPQWSSNKVYVCILWEMELRTSRTKVASVTLQVATASSIQHLPFRSQSLVGSTKWIHCVQNNINTITRQSTRHTDYIQYDWHWLTIDSINLVFLQILTHDKRRLWQIRFELKMNSTMNNDSGKITTYN